MPIYAQENHVKVEFPDETTGIGEWIWVTAATPRGMATLAGSIRIVGHELPRPEDFVLAVSPCLNEN
jgi:hypothetical protein